MSETWQDLVTRGRRMPHGPAQRAAYDEALGIAQAAGDERAEYEIRYWLTSCANGTGDTDTMLSSFAWCLAKHDADPATYPLERTDGYAGLLWEFKWMIGALDRSPIFSLAQCEAMLDDMEARYRRADVGLSGVYIARFGHAWATGDLERARHYRTLLTTTPRDRYSDCEACVRSILASFAAETGDEETALQLVDEMAEQNLQCQEEPERAMANTLLAKLRAGRLAEARNAHMWAYRVSRNNPSLIRAIGDHMEFCALTGNEARGLAMVERHLPWLAHDGLDAAGQMDLLIAIGMVLEAVVRAGYGAQGVRGADAPALLPFFGTDSTDQLPARVSTVSTHQAVEPPGGFDTVASGHLLNRLAVGHPPVGWTVETLAPVVRAAADRLAAAFDARNGNTYISGLVAARRAHLDEHYDVPIATDVFAAPAPVNAEPATPADWLDRAQLLAYANQEAESREAALRVLDGGTTEQRRRALGLLISVAVRAGEEDEANRWLPLRIAAMEEAGYTAEAESERRTGLATYGRCTDEDVATMEAERERLASTADVALASVEVPLAGTIAQRAAKLDPEAQKAAYAQAEDVFAAAAGRTAARTAIRVSAMRGQATCQAVRGEFASALALVDEALAMAEPDDRERVAMLGLKARVLGSLQRWEEAARAADAATAMFAAHGVTAGVVEYAGLAGAFLHQADEYTEELSRLRYAARAAEQAGTPDHGLRTRLGAALVNTGHPQEGIEYLWQVRQEQEQDGTPPAERATTCGELAWGFEVGSLYPSAAWMYDQAGDLWEEAGQKLSAADLHRRQANVLRWIERYDEAVTVYNQAWDLAADSDERGLKIAILEGRALGKAGAGDQSGPADFDAALDLARAMEAPPERIAGLTEGKGRALARLKRYDEAVAYFLQAADAYGESAGGADAAQAMHFAAHTLVDLERYQEAVPLWYDALVRVDRALSTGTQVKPLRDSILVQLAETLDKLGRTAEAAEVRARAA